MQYASASDFWAAADALRGLADAAATLSKGDLTSGTKDDLPSPTTPSGAPKGPGGVSLMYDSEEEEAPAASIPEQPVVLPITPARSRAGSVSMQQLYNDATRPYTYSHQPSLLIKAFRPVLLSHTWQSEQTVLRHHELRYGFQEGYKHFQPMHSPVLHALPPPPPPPAAATSPLVQQQMPQSPMVMQQIPKLPSPHNMPIRASVRSHFKRPKQMYKCMWEGCTKEFAKPSLLRSHELIHENIKPFQCQFCPVAFSRNHDLKRHERCVHQVGGKEAHCRRCNKLFTRSDSARFHEKTCGGVGASDSSELSV